MYQWTKPRLAIPVHGEAKHMRANARLAEEVGVPHQLVGQNGDLFDLVASRIDKGEVVTGRLWYDEGNRKLVPVR